MSNFPEKSITKVFSAMLLALRGGGGGCQISRKKRYITLEWPLRSPLRCPMSDRNSVVPVFSVETPNMFVNSTNLSWRLNANCHYLHRMFQ